MDWFAGKFAGKFLGWFGEDASSTFDGFGDAGVDTLVLDLEQGFKVRHSWVTNVIKARGGGEQRSSRNDTDREGYSGKAYLSGISPRATRAKLARYAAIGPLFLLGLPHEALSLRADAAGTRVFVSAAALAKRDWAKAGQRVVVARRNATTKQLDFVNAVIQSKTVNSIDLNVAPGAIGKAYGWIMPAKAVYLSPQQNFARHVTTVEKWSLEALGAPPLDFAPTLASLSLDPITVSAGLNGVVVTSRRFGIVGNTQRFQLDHNAAAPAAGELGIDVSGLTVFTFKGGTTTIGDLATALTGSPYVILTGTYNPGDIIAAGDAFPATFLAGGLDAGDVGTGVALTTYNGDGTVRPVWDRRLDNGTTLTDGIHAMTQIIDRGGIPTSLGMAYQADWFRAVSIAGGDDTDWQLFKLFMWTVRGREKKFWLPTWAHDLTFISKAVNTITVSTTDGSDFAAWWPELREHIQIVETSGVITRAKITAAVDNGNGTRTLTIGTTLASSAVEMVSWLELCRFENADEFETTHGKSGFDVSLKARVVP